MNCGFLVNGHWGSLDMSIRIEWGRNNRIGRQTKQFRSSSRISTSIIHLFSTVHNIQDRSSNLNRSGSLAVSSVRKRILKSFICYIRLIAAMQALRSSMRSVHYGSSEDGATLERQHARFADKASTNDRQSSLGIRRKLVSALRSLTNSGKFNHLKSGSVYKTDPSPSVRR